MGGQKNDQFVWTPTKRRGPIAAEFTTPGPAAIGLPTTFGSKVTVTKNRSPAFTISGRHESRPSTASPGPGQYNINGLTYKAGKDEPHAPSMHIRPKDPKPFVTPAPGDYCPEKSKKVLDQAPKFSFGIKTDPGLATDVPAPNSYNIPSLIGSSGKSGGPHQAAPSFTITARPREIEDKMKIPGPGSYNEAVVDKYKTAKSPAFSMGQRTNIPSDHTQKPGPGAHCPEKCMQRSGPKFSMAARLKDIGKNTVPGPGTYNTPNLDVYLERMPRFSISPRTEILLDKSSKPSPNTYSPEKCLQDSGPKWTIAARLNEIGVSNIPGPGTYEAGDINAFRERQPVYSMRPKTEIPTDRGPKPSPNAYYPEKFVADEGPKWTIAGRPKEVQKSHVPGPGSYEAGNIDTVKDRQPAYTMRPKTELPTDKSPKPSPNTYSPEKCVLDSAPKWTMAPRTELPSDKSPKPSPNTYCPEKYDLDSTPRWTMAPRTELPSDKSPKPSPNTYCPEKCILETTPKWTMSPRIEIPADKTPKPSPNAYNPDETAMIRRNPEFSFGIKHSQYLGQLRDQ